MNGLERIVSFTLNLISGTLGSQTVSIPAIITNEAPNPGGSFGTGRAKLYAINDLRVVAEDFSQSGVTYQAASAIAGVTPRVNKFYVIRRNSAVAGVVDIDFDASLVTGNTISGTINGNAISVPFNTNNATTLTDLANAIQALPMVNTAVSDGVDTVTVTFELEWIPEVGTFVVTGGMTQPNVTVSVVTNAYTIQDDIAAAIAEDATNKWFMLLPTTTNTGAILAAAEYVESLNQLKMLMVHSTEPGIYQPGSDDVASQLQAASYNRTAIVYHDDSTEMVHCRWASRCLAIDPGQGTWANRSLTGATAAPRNTSEINILESKNANSYTMAGPGPLTRRGVVASGKPIEMVRDSFYAINELNTALYNLFTTVEKIPYNSAGQTLISNTGNGVVRRMVLEGVFNAESSEPAQFIVPDPDTISETDKNNRIWPDCLLLSEHLRAVISLEYLANIVV